MEPVRFGIIGVGNMGADHARKMKAGKASGAVLTSICDIDQSRLSQLSGELDVAGFPDYKEMIDSGLCDAVLVATPHYWHAPQAVYAARRGLHVLCEKPISVTVGVAKTMVEQCRQANVKLGIMFMQRLRPFVRKVQEILASGQIGEVFRVSMVASNWLRNQSYYDSGGWRGTWLGEGGGILMNQAPHSLDIFVLCAGMPRRVTASVQTRTHRIEVENTANAILDYGPGKTSYIYATTAEAPGVEELYISGTKGSLIARGGKLQMAVLEQPLDEFLLSCPQGFKRPASSWTDVAIEGEDPAHMGVVAQFCRAVREDEPLVADGQDGINEIELCDAIYLSGFSGGKTVELPLNAEEVERLIRRLAQQRGRQDAQDLRTPAMRDLKQILRQTKK